MQAHCYASTTTSLIGSECVRVGALGRGSNNFTEHLRPLTVLKIPKAMLASTGIGTGQDNFWGAGAEGASGRGLNAG